MVGRVMKVIREGRNTKLGRQGCQNLVYTDVGRKRETDKMPPEEHVGVLFPGGVLALSCDSKASQGTKGKGVCR